MTLFSQGIPNTLLPQQKLCYTQSNFLSFFILAKNEQHSSTLVEARADEDIAAAEIGRFTPRSEGLKLRTVDGLRDLPRFPRDEIARYFGE